MPTEQFKRELALIWLSLLILAISWLATIFFIGAGLKRLDSNINASFTYTDQKAEAIMYSVNAVARRQVSK